MIETEELITSSATDPEEQIAHWAHVECQEGAPFVTVGCGAVKDWTQEKPDIPDGWEWCVYCKATNICPVCGVQMP